LSTVLKASKEIIIVNIYIVNAHYYQAVTLFSQMSYTCVWQINVQLWY